MLHCYKDDLIVILIVDRNLFCWVSWAILLFVQWILWVVTLTMLFLYYQGMSFGTTTIWEPIGKFFPTRHLKSFVGPRNHGGWTHLHIRLISSDLIFQLLIIKCFIWSLMVMVDWRHHFAWSRMIEPRYDIIDERRTITITVIEPKPKSNLLRSFYKPNPSQVHNEEEDFLLQTRSWL